VGRLEAQPGAGNVIAGTCRASLDVRHAIDPVRLAAVGRILESARPIAARRNLAASWAPNLDQPAIPTAASLTARPVQPAPQPSFRMVSGAGHDAMIMAERMPAAMLFLRTPGGVSHHPDESVLEADVAAALAVGRGFLEALDESLCK